MVTTKRFSSSAQQNSKPSGSSHADAFGQFTVEQMDHQCCKSPMHAKTGF